MSKYDVYGVGNALVDIEYRVTPEQLQELNIEKGVMTLVDEPLQTQIVECLGAHESNRGSGGSAANTIIAVSQLGGKASYSCRVANDDMGRFYLQDLARAGVTTSIQSRQHGSRNHWQMPGIGHSRCGSNDEHLSRRVGRLVAGRCG